MNTLLILVPFLSVLILNLPFRSLMKKAALRLGFYLSLAQIFFALSPDLVKASNAFDMTRRLFQFDLQIDGLSQVVLLAIGLILATAFLMAKTLISNDDKVSNFASLVLLLMAGLNGVVLVTDIFSLYVFLEISAIASFILIAFYKEEASLEAAFKYIVLSAMATMLMLLAIALILVVSADTSFAGISAAAQNSANVLFLMFAIAIFLCGLLIKAGVMPFHGWLPDAYTAAPGPVSVLLAGIVTKVLGIYTLIRIFGFVLPASPSINQVLLLAGSLSIVLGALAALGQSDLKRMLSYSSISQVGYIIVGLGCGTPLGVLGAVFHFFNHATFKSLLFVNAAAVERQCGRTNMDQLSGLAARMPFTGITSVLGLLSASGIPPLAGFWSKLIIIVALWACGQYAYAVIAAMASVLTLAYFLYMQRRVFFGKIAEDLQGVQEAGLGLIVPSVVLGAITVGVGLAFPAFINIYLWPVIQGWRG